MFSSLFKESRRAKILATPFPPEWLEILQARVPFYRLLSPEEQVKIKTDVQVFCAEKKWEGCGGLEITDEIKVTIAAHACLLLLGVEHDYYERVLSILVYPKGFQGGTEPALGEAWYRGPVVLSWDDILNPTPGQNLVIHEFAHQLDMLDGAIDGTPPLANRKEALRWRKIMTREYQELIRRAKAGKRTLLDKYGTKDEGEFFAVATECFFEEPVAMKAGHPRLYKLLANYFKQDPAARLSSVL